MRGVFHHPNPYGIAVILAAFGTEAKMRWELGEPKCLTEYSGVGRRVTQDKEGLIDFYILNNYIYVVLVPVDT
jgi:hypothetical protein